MLLCIVISILVSSIYGGSDITWFTLACYSNPHGTRLILSLGFRHRSRSPTRSNLTLASILVFSNNAHNDNHPTSESVQRRLERDSCGFASRSGAISCVASLFAILCAVMLTIPRIPTVYEPYLRPLSARLFAAISCTSGSHVAAHRFTATTRPLIQTRQ